MSQEITVAEMLVKCLEAEGVKYIFGIPGEENLDMMNALEKSDIRILSSSQSDMNRERPLWQISMAD